MHFLHFLRHFNTLETVIFLGLFYALFTVCWAVFSIFLFVKFLVVLLDLNEVTRSLSGSRD